MNINIRNKGYVYYGEIHFSSSSATKVYNGEPLTESTPPIMSCTYDVDAKHLDTLSKAITAEAVGSQTSVGSSANTIRVTIHPDLIDRRQYSKIVRNEGTLTVYPPSIDPEDPEDPEPEDPDAPTID